MIKDKVRAVIGRRISDVILTTMPPARPDSRLSHIYLVFASGHYYELWSPRPILVRGDDPVGGVRGVLGKRIRSLTILHSMVSPDNPDWDNARLVITMDDGASCTFESESDIRTTSYLLDDGLIGALGYFPDEIVLLHASTRATPMYVVSTVTASQPGSS